MVASAQRVGDTRQFPPATYAATPAAPPVLPGQLQCRACGYPNEPARIRCERCGHAMRQAQPQAVALGPPPVAPPRRSQWLIWLLIALGALCLLGLAVALFWDQITGTA
ncbi:hypothetical protein ACFQ1L_26310 [Phytohabitans flavus]